MWTRNDQSLTMLCPDCFSIRPITEQNSFRYGSNIAGQTQSSQNDSDGTRVQ
ncbi:hypothetical protein SERLA73DRAFT_175204 [Serpula lacrymans var. lacrymans S7.3]|uniref:Uncharacterized protein n=1 Tax=Serpula lacrymans var. lacrymans (strain S7.3) TaxID=936435 RepID=F8PL04_SERL3|nr:hypothetical protein SERLA73DRAFT_175204 [Serpula lacrymans var. lacrymans S7.3]